MATSRKRLVKVFFDTSVIYTQVASDLFKPEVAEFLVTPNNDPELQVTWYLPEVVKAEREYQMNARAVELLPGLAKLERVLGHQLGINPEVVKERIASTIQKQLTANKVALANLDPAQVPWTAVIDAAVNRKPPFQPGEKEKGFRDAMIAETFLQEADRSPRTPSLCLMVLVSEDELLREAVKLRTASIKNVRVLADLDELKGLMNTLSSEVSEEYVEELRVKAAALFWTTPDDKTTLYYTAEVGKQINDQFAAELTAIPEGILRVNTKMNYITSTPNFVRKEGPTLRWATKIRVDQELFRRPKPSGLLAQEATNDKASSILSGLLSLATPEESAGTRSLVFYAFWTTRVNTKKQLSNVRLEAVRLDPAGTEIKFATARA